MTTYDLLCRECTTCRYDDCFGELCQAYAVHGVSIDSKSNYYDIGNFSVWAVLIAKAKHIANPVWAIAFFNIGKYALRWPFKHDDPRRDIEKIIKYCNMLLGELEGE